MDSSPRFLIIGGLVLAGAFVVFVAIHPLLRSPVNSEASNTNKQNNSEQNSLFRIPQNAFLPHQGTAPSLFSDLDSTEKNKQISESPQSSTFSLSIPPPSSLERISQLIPQAMPPPANQLLPLPLPRDQELAIEPSGVHTIQEYLEYFGAHSKDIVFDYQKFNGVLKNKDGTFLLPAELIGQALKENDFQKIHQSLSVFKEFLTTKKTFLKTIKVFGETATLNKKMVAFDTLTLDLIDKAFGVETNELPQSTLQEFYDKYITTAEFYHQELAQRLQLTLKRPRSGNFFHELAELFGVANLAFAQVFPPFGGLIMPFPATTECSCPPTGLQITVGPPGPGVFYLTTPFMLSPLFFPFKAPHPGAWILGIYSPLTLLPCNFFPACLELLPVVTMAGTST